MLESLLLMLAGTLMFVDPKGFLDKTNRLSANLHSVVDAPFAWRLQFKEKPLKSPRHLLIAVRVVGGAIATVGTLFLYAAVTRIL